MRLTLLPHPQTPCEAVETIEVDVARGEGGALALRFIVAGEIAALRLPPPLERARADELWQETCFEAFVKPRGGEAYHEFNLSPSNRWAGYRFDGYRQGMASLDGVALTHLTRRASDDLYELVATLDFDAETGLDQDLAWSLGLSAVIEEASGAKSYWALAHAPGKPDFHHPDAFAYVLEPA